MENGRLSGLVATQFDDLLSADNESFDTATTLLERTFDAKPLICPPLIFSTIAITPAPDGGYMLEQRDYTPNLRHLTSEATV